jgi:hypothetical protein
MILQYNEAITFGKFGTFAQLSPIGFDVSEDSRQSWTVAQSCEFQASLSIPRQDIAFFIDATPFTIPDRIAVQPLFIYVNGLFQGFHTFRGSMVLQIPIRRHAITSRSTRIQFVLPNAVSPSSLGISSDLRELGLAITEMRFDAL